MKTKLKNIVEFKIVEFKDLSANLKIAIVIAWILGILNAIAFIYGFVWGLGL